MKLGLLTLRKKLKQKKPTFLRQDGHKKVKLRKNWRQPKGMHSSMRKKKKSYRKHPSMGYSSPKKVRGLTNKGLIPIKVYNLEDLEGLTKQHGILIGRTVGMKNKIEILKSIKSKQLILQITNNVDDFLNKSQNQYKLKKEEQLKRKKKKEESKKKQKLEIKKKEEKKEESVEEKQKEEKEKKKKVLEKGQ